MSGDWLVQLSDVGLLYKRRVGLFRSDSHCALSGLSFEVYRGETLGLVGGNGAGKTSLLRLLAGILPPSTGKVRSRARSSAFLGIHAGLDGKLSGRDNIALAGFLMGVSANEIAAQMEAIIDFSEIGAYIERPVETYSAGMKARLGFSISILLQPALLLIDEILAVGDASFREKSSHALRTKLSGKQTTVLVSHNLDQIRSLCDRAIWIKDGRCAAVGPASEVVAAAKENA